MKSTQQLVIDFLRTNPNSTGAEILQSTSKTKSSIDSAIKALRDKGFCRKSNFQENAWRYELTKSCERNGFSSVAPDQSIIISSTDGAAGRRPFVSAPYVPGAWESVRPGADDHKRHQSMGALSHFKGQW